MTFKTVRGVTVSEQLAYHAHHTWMRNTGEQTAAVGLDDLARRIVGPVDKVVFPLVGSTVTAGETCVKLIAGNREVAVVAPASGEIVEVNKALVYDAKKVTEDPYGEGWLFRIRSWRLEDQERQMIKGEEVSAWMEQSIEKLLGGLNGTAGAVSQDGGYLAEDLFEYSSKHDWIQIVRKHLGTEPRLKA